MITAAELGIGPDIRNLEMLRFIALDDDHTDDTDDEEGAP